MYYIRNLKRSNSSEEVKENSSSADKDPERDKDSPVEDTGRKEQQKKNAFRNRKHITI